MNISERGSVSSGRRLIVVLAALLTAVATVSGIQPAAAEGANAPVDSVLCGQPGDITVRLYRLFFGRVPDPGGLSYWSGIYLDQDDDAAARVAGWMSDSTEYKTKWANTTDEEYVEGLLYGNLLDRDPDAGGLAYWLGFLSGPDALTRAEMAVFWVIQPEFDTQHPVAKPADCDLLDEVQNIPGGRALAFDYLTTDLKASATRCSGVSINANWVHRDGALPFSEHIGFANINGVNVPSRNNGNGNVYTEWGDDSARGVFGARRIGEGGEVPNFSWQFDAGVGPINILSNLVEKDESMLQLHANYWDENPTTPWYDGEKFDGKNQGWDWAVGGISMVVDGDYNVVTAGQDYTFNTTRHSFVAFKAPSTVMIGATTTMTANQLVVWLDGQGYKDIMKMDGGGSLEMTEGAQTTVGGTSRPLPVWLGVGCP